MGEKTSVPFAQMHEAKTDPELVATSYTVPNLTIDENFGPVLSYSFLQFSVTTILLIFLFTMIRVSFWKSCIIYLGLILSSIIGYQLMISYPGSGEFVKNFALQTKTYVKDSFNVLTIIK